MEPSAVAGSSRVLSMARASGSLRRRKSMSELLMKRQHEQLEQRRRERIREVEEEKPTDAVPASSTKATDSPVQLEASRRGGAQQPQSAQRRWPSEAGAAQTSSTGGDGGDDAGVTAEGELRSERRFVHGLGPCPPPPDGDTAYFRAATHLNARDANPQEAAQVVQEFATFCKAVYASRADHPHAFQWNDVVQSALEAPFDTWQCVQAWSDLNAAVKRFHATAVDRCLPVARGFLATTKAKAIGAFTRVGLGSFAHDASGLFVHVWHSAQQARRFMSATARLSQAVFEQRVGMIHAPLSCIAFYRGHHFTVTAAVPLLVGGPVDLDASPAHLLLAACAARLRAGIGAAPSADLALHRGGDGRFYTLAVDAALALAVSAPEKGVQFTLRYEALRYVLPHLAAHHRQGQQQQQQQQKQQEEEGPASSSPSLPVHKSDDVAAPGRANQDGRSHTIVLVTSPLVAKSASPLPHDAVFRILMSEAIPRCARDLLEEALLLTATPAQRPQNTDASSADATAGAPSPTDIFRANLIMRCLRKHGINVRFLYTLLTVAPFEPRPRAKPGAPPHLHATLDALRSAILIEMLRRTLKVMIRGLIYTHAQEDRTEASSANRANWLVALCASTTNGVWKRHVLAVLRDKFNVPKALHLGYEEGLMQQLVSYASSRLGIVYDEAARRFTGFKLVTYPFGSNTNAINFFSREAFEDYVVHYNAAQERLQKLRLVAAAFEGKKGMMAIRRIQMVFRRCVQQRRMQLSEPSPFAAEDADRPFAAAASAATKSSGASSGDAPAGHIAQPRRDTQVFVALGLARRLKELESDLRDALAQPERGAAAQQYVDALRVRFACLTTLSVPLLLEPSVVGNRVDVLLADQNAERRALIEHTLSALERRQLPALEETATAAAPSGTLMMAAASGVLVDLSIAVQRARMLLRMPHSGAQSSEREGEGEGEGDELGGNVSAAPLSSQRQGAGMPEASIAMLQQHLAALRKTTAPLNQWHAGLRLRLLGHALDRPLLIAEGVKCMLRVSHVDRAYFRSFFGVAMEAARGLAANVPRRAVGHGKSSDLLDILRIATREADAVPRDAYSRRGGVLGVMRAVTAALVESHDPKMCFDLLCVSEDSFRWHLQRYGFRDLQTAIAIVQLVAVSVYRHLPLLTEHQEALLNSFRRIIAGIGAQKPSAVRALLSSVSFLSMLEDVVAMMSDVRDYGPAELIANEAKAIGALRSHQEQQQQQQQHRLAATDDHTDWSADSPRGCASGARAESPPTTPQAALRSPKQVRFHLPAAPQVDSGSSSSSSCGDVGEDGKDGGGPIDGGATSTADDWSRGRSELARTKSALDVHQELLADAGFDETRAVQMAAEAQRECISVGEALVAIVQRRIFNDWQLQLLDVQLEEEHARQLLVEAECSPARLFPLYLDAVEERETLLRAAIAAQEKAERIRCPGCMEAHLWLLLVTEATQRRACDRRDAKDAATLARLDVLERRRQLAQQWTEVRRALIAESHAEQEMRREHAQLAATEGFRRRQLLDAERHAVRALVVLEREHRGAMKRHEVLLQKLEAKQMATAEQLEELLRQRVAVVEGREDAARTLLRDAEARAWATGVVARAEASRRAVERFEDDAQHAAERAAAAIVAMREADARQRQREQRLLEVMERKFESAEAIRRERQRRERERRQSNAHSRGDASHHSPSIDGNGGRASAEVAATSALQRRSGTTFSAEAAHRGQLNDVEARARAALLSRHLRVAAAVVVAARLTKIDEEAEEARGGEYSVELLEQAVEAGGPTALPRAEEAESALRVRLEEHEARARGQISAVASIVLTVDAADANKAAPPPGGSKQRPASDSETKIALGDAASSSTGSRENSDDAEHRSYSDDSDFDSVSSESPACAATVARGKAVAADEEAQDRWASDRHADDARQAALLALLQHKMGVLQESEVARRSTVASEEAQLRDLLHERAARQHRLIDAQVREAAEEAARAAAAEHGAAAEHARKVAQLERVEAQLLAKAREAAAIRHEAAAVADLRRAVEGELVQQRLQRQRELLEHSELAERSKLVIESEKRGRAILVRCARRRDVMAARSSSTDSSSGSSRGHEAADERKDERLRRIVAAARAARIRRGMTAAQRMRHEARRRREEARAQAELEERLALVARKMSDLLAREEAGRRTLALEAQFERDAALCAFDKARGRMCLEQQRIRERESAEEAVLVRRLERRAQQREAAQRRLQMSYAQLDEQRQQEAALRREREDAERLEAERRRRYDAERAQREQARQRTVKQIMVMMAQKKAERAEQRLEMHQPRQKQQAMGARITDGGDGTAEPPECATGSFLPSKRTLAPLVRASMPPPPQSTAHASPLRSPPARARFGVVSPLDL